MRIAAVNVTRRHLELLEKVDERTNQPFAISGLVTTTDLNVYHLSAVNLSGLQCPLNSEICHRCSNSPAAAPHPPPASATMASSPQIAQPSASTPSPPTQNHQPARASKLSPQESPTTPDTSDCHRCCKSAKSSYDPSRWCRFWQTL